MSYEEKGTWLFLVITVVGFATYLTLVLMQLADVPLVETQWVAPMIWTIVGAIVAAIVGRIVVEIVSPSETTRADQRDREIERTGDRVGNSFVVLGALGGLVLAMLDADAFWIANAIYLGFVLGGLISSIVRLVAYRSGGFQSW